MIRRAAQLGFGALFLWLAYRSVVGDPGNLGLVGAIAAKVGVGSLLCGVAGLFLGPLVEPWLPRKPAPAVLGTLCPTCGARSAPCPCPRPVGGWTRGASAGSSLLAVGFALGALGLGVAFVVGYPGRSAAAAATSVALGALVIVTGALSSAALVVVERDRRRGAGTWSYVADGVRAKAEVRDGRLVDATGEVLSVTPAMEPPEADPDDPIAVALVDGVRRLWERGAVALDERRLRRWSALGPEETEVLGWQVRAVADDELVRWLDSGSGVGLEVLVDRILREGREEELAGWRARVG